MAESWKKLKPSYMVLSFILCLNRNRSALVCDLFSNNSLFVSQMYEDQITSVFSNNSLFVSQMYEDKSLALHTRDLIFTTDLQTANYYPTNHC